MKYFCADPHFDRKNRNVLSRPFKDCYEMGEYFLEQINSTVKKNDVLYILGDFAFTWADTVWYRQRIKCKNIFITRGNHDITLNRLKQVFGKNFVENILETSIKDLHLELCHYPMLYWNHSHRNSACLHGHLHDQRTETYMKLIPDIRLLDVSFDSAKTLFNEYRLFSKDEVYDIISSRKGHDDVNFYKQLRGEYKKDE